MIGNWRRSKDSYASLIQRVSILISVIGFGGKRQKMVVYLSKLVLTYWKVEDCFNAYKDAVESYCSHKGRFLCLGSLVGQDFNHGSA